MEQVFRQFKDKGQSGDGTLEGELVAARENDDLKMERQIQKMIRVDHRDGLEKRDTQKAQSHDLLAVFNPHQGGDPSLRSSTDDPGFVAAITQDSAGPEDDDEGDDDWDARDEDDGEDGGCLEGPRSLRPSPTLFLATRGRRAADLADLRSALVATEDRGRTHKCQFHKENKELKLANLNLERERLADDKARHDRENRPWKRTGGGRGR
ncbi:hypothetical protein I305_00539 [Cryptococcus gattii E566]|uniref:Uncharacterized protein n=2 Tax=Cryptococcus gattii TaxID=37769 RepID=E6R2H2_CRYGW|nr:Hypothetical Protein CGB_C9645C [Cryptococcus gattii WM276]ADV21390.1 Hypothetical Protein CGB_C9645C [Cryptococcus gattii WM276]KIR81662.1 hypothetical protein I306_01250 [Cryptococcus gattii EJB2]KIY36491.1 hypothetical protein I305_00539 [Cryptococcus gattii E566]